MGETEKKFSSFVKPVPNDKGTHTMNGCQYTIIDKFLDSPADCITTNGIYFAEFTFRWDFFIRF
jgi:hypothetical protein